MTYILPLTFFYMDKMYIKYRLYYGAETYQNCCIGISN